LTYKNNISLHLRTIATVETNIRFIGLFFKKENRGIKKEKPRTGRG
jgi:hypothetical protein